MRSSLPVSFVDQLKTSCSFPFFSSYPALRGWVEEQAIGVPLDSLLESDALTHCYFFIAKIRVDMGMTLQGGRPFLLALGRFS
jgi:hypothetical protein